MSMKSISNSILAMSLMMGGGFLASHDSRNMGRFKLDNMRHSDGLCPDLNWNEKEIPNGCKMEVIKFTFRKEGFESDLCMDINIVFGTEKSKAKKINVCRKTIQAYIDFTPINLLLKRNEFIIK